MTKRIRLVVVLVVIAIVTIVCLSGIYVVNQGEQAVVLTFGNITDTKDSGTYWYFPLIQSVRKESTTQMHTVEYGYRTLQASTTQTAASYQEHPEESIMLTSDQNIVSVEAVFQYRVDDVQAYFYNVDDQVDSMRYAFETVLRRNLQNRTLDDAMINKLQIADQVLPDFKEMLKPYGLGVTVSSVMIQNINVPKEVQAAYEDVINASTEKTKNNDEAEKYRNQVVPNAKAQAYKMLQDAQAYSAKAIANAQGDVSQFNSVLANYINSKEVTRTRLLIETLESILKNANKVYIMDDSSGALKLLNLNDSAVQPAASGTAAPVPTTSAGGN